MWICVGNTICINDLERVSLVGRAGKLQGKTRASVEAVKPLLMFPVQRNGSGEDALQSEVGGLLSVADCALDFWGKIRKLSTGSDMHIVMARLPGNICERHTGGQGFGPTMSGTKVSAVHGATQIDIATAKAMHDEGRLFLDVQGYFEWRRSHVPGAIRGSSINEAKLAEIADKNEEIVFY